MKVITHITRAQDWRAAQAAGAYRADTLTEEGFIHCSSPDQVLGVANSLYTGQHGLVLLLIDLQKLTSPVKWEGASEGAELFPHIYGPINLEAVVRAETFEPDADGRWSELPA